MTQVLCPYTEGGGITLQPQTGQNPINARIIKVFRPLTLSAVMVVQLDSHIPSLQGHIVLKLYDRRFVASDRETLGPGPWTPQVEAKYQKFVRDGGASQFLHKLESDRDFLDREGDTWDVAENEAYFDHEMQSLYKTEKEVYQRAHKLQGRDIPRLLLDVVLTLFSDAIPPDFRCPGILLQFISGFSLVDMATHAPKEHWQHIGDEAIRIVHAIGDLGILNKDVQRRSFIVHRDQHTNKFKVVMIDFALVIFREQVESERKWRELKATQDEEGAVGYVLQDKYYPAFVYRRSQEYDKLDLDFKSE